MNAMFVMPTKRNTMNWVNVRAYPELIAGTKNNTAETDIFFRPNASPDLSTHKAPMMQLLPPNL
jgi:hypothetical protein